MISPIDEARAMTPWWMMEINRFDGLEIHPCRKVQGPQGLFEEQCDPEGAEFWSVFGHRIEGGIQCFEDFATEAKAQAFAAKLLEAYPHLREFGLLG